MFQQIFPNTDITIHVGYVYTSHKINRRVQYLSDIVQDPHIDYTWPYATKHSKTVYVGIMPITNDGAFLEVWIPTKVGDKINAVAKLLYIPYGYFVLFPAITIHAGGFVTDKVNGNLRLHFYLYLNEKIDTEQKSNTYNDASGKPLYEYLLHSDIVTKGGGICDGIL